MIRRGAALLVLIGSVLIVRLAMSVDGAADLRSTALAFGFALIAAVLAGDLVERLRLPRLSGYLLFGLACGPFAADLISRAMATDLRRVNDLAVALIALIAGLEMNMARLRRSLGAITKIGIVVLGGSITLFFAAFALFWPWLPFPDPGSLAGRVTLAFVVALLTVSFSPTLTIAVVAESRASGPLTSLVMALVVLADLVLIVAFALALQMVRVTGGVESVQEAGFVAMLAWELIGSVAFGAAVGALFALYLRAIGRELTVVLIAVCGLLAGISQWLHFEVVLASLTAGLVVENVAPPKGDSLKLAVERSALPVLVVFFAAAGASLQLDALASIGALALLIVVARAAILYAATSVGTRWSGLEEPAPLAWYGLISQGGVTLGLASLVAADFPEWGVPVYTLILALTGIHVLVGPVLFRAALARAGEIGRS